MNINPYAPPVEQSTPTPATQLDALCLEHPAYEAEIRAVYATGTQRHVAGQLRKIDPKTTLGYWLGTVLGLCILLLLNK